jgi:hypothetical protein
MTQSDEQIWNLLVSKSIEHDFEDCDPEHKQDLIDGYKICQDKTNNFKTVSEEEVYFMRDTVTHFFNLSLISRNE